MRCKVGDLCVMIQSDYVENIGKLFKTIKKTGEENYWEVESICSARNGFGMQPPGTLGEARDSDLRPIRDPGDDAKDQTLEWLPVPSKQKEHA